MSVVIITGDHPRHCYFAQSLCQSGQVAGIIYEKREPFMFADTYGVTDAHLSHLVKYHFDKRAEAEDNFFGSAIQTKDVPTLNVTLDELNGPKSIKFLQELKPSLVISYGCHKLSSKLMGCVPNCRFWNTHGGLSPDYRGTTTHFWPSYMLEVQMTGMTLHETTDKLDGGDIIFQTGYKLTKDDTLHMVACRTVQDYSKLLSSFLQRLDYNNLPPGIFQKHTGKLWMSSDWRPEHLYLIYDIYKDNIVNLTMQGELAGRTPKLIDALSEHID